ncbi:SDR family NAD(P)-dependent oxidoreductase [Burkholderia gladioli]|uniref:SDR family NAD(P)-dependent oxidoreductase n=1 Tax=Burkholderia gladioli TaxID=28095 RepID=UPI0034DACC82
MISGADGPASIFPCLRGNGNPIAEEQDKVAYDLQGKVVLITGAAGGIGAATARELHACGARLVLTDVTQASVDRLAAEFGPERTLALALDVTDAAATRAVVQRTVNRFGRLDIAFANAASHGTMYPPPCTAAMNRSSNESSRSTCSASGARSRLHCRRSCAIEAKSWSQLPSMRS